MKMDLEKEYKDKLKMKTFVKWFNSLSDKEQIRVIDNALKKLNIRTKNEFKKI